LLGSSCAPNRVQNATGIVEYLLDLRISDTLVSFDRTIWDCVSLSTATIRGGSRLWRPTERTRFRPSHAGHGAPVLTAVIAGRTRVHGTSLIGAREDREPINVAWSYSSSTPKTGMMARV
jgi:hypothetical protein